MLDPIRGTKALVLGAMALCLAGTLYGARADDKNAVGVRIAIVDPQRLINEDNVYNAKVTDLNKQQNEIAAELQTVSQNYLLADAEQKQLTVIVIKESGGIKQELTPAEKETKKRLTEKSKTALDDFDTLQRKPAGQLTPDEDKRLHEYIKQREDATIRAQGRQTSATEDLQKQAGDNMKTTLKSVHDALSKIAREKGYNVVLSNEVAWYADTDLTDDVIKQLNRK